MKALILKEIRSYLSSIIGYAAIIVFLISSGFFVWILPGNNNIIDMGDSSLQTFFSQAPGILMFLFPAFTMRCFAEENKTCNYACFNPIFNFHILKLLSFSFSRVIVLFFSF